MSPFVILLMIASLQPHVTKAFGSRPLLPVLPRSIIRSRAHLSSLSSSASPISKDDPQRIAVLGGGLAGLSTAYHLIEQRQLIGLKRPLELTIVDKHEVGTGGASAVAGGLVHPLSPRGKVVHWGREGLEATNHLVQRASETVVTAGQNNSNTIVLRSELFRIATSPKQAEQLQVTARDEIPDLCQWMDPGELANRLGLSTTDSNNYGGLRLRNGCQVIHLPSYLRGLWAACQALAQSDPEVTMQWKLDDIHSIDDNDYSDLVWAAGSGLFEGDSIPSAVDDSELPVQLVRGQSVEITLTNTRSLQQEALLSGKYVSPLPEPDRVLVGATHEFSEVPMSLREVKQLLQERTESFCPHVWDESAAIVDKFTAGTRVQSQRGASGRLPIVGKLLHNKGASMSWIFTGLSSRGLLYHAVYGKLLAQSILEGTENSLEKNCIGFDWWRQPSQVK